MDADTLFLIKLITAFALFFSLIWGVIDTNFKLLFGLYPAYIIGAAIVVPTYNLNGICEKCHNFNWFEVASIMFIAYPLAVFAGFILKAVFGIEGSGIQKPKTLKMSPYQAMGIMNQRVSGRNTGIDTRIDYNGEDYHQPVIATLKDGCGRDEWKYAADIWEKTNDGNNFGVTIVFENSDHIPTYQNGYIVPSNPNAFRENNYQGNNQMTAEEISENRWKNW